MITALHQGKPLESISSCSCQTIKHFLRQWQPQKRVYLLMSLNGSANSSDTIQTCCLGSQ